jgi:hypothetical protein
MRKEEEKGYSENLQKGGSVLVPRVTLVEPYDESMEQRCHDIGLNSVSLLTHVKVNEKFEKFGTCQNGNGFAGT